MRIRAEENWRHMDFILLAKILKMEADIRAAKVELMWRALWLRISAVNKFQTR